MVVSSNRWVDWRPFLRHLHYLAVAPPPLLVNRIIMRRVYSAMGGIMTGMTGCVVSPGRTLPMCGSIAPLASASDR